MIHREAFEHSLHFVKNHGEIIMLLSKSARVQLGFGIVVIIIGIIAIILRTEDVVMDKFLAADLPLISHTAMYKFWTSTELEFCVYMFHVVNPKEVQEKGAVAILAETGPYVYDEVLLRTPISVNESADTITYTTKRMFSFNPTKSGTLSENDEITILNPAHLGSILMLESIMPALLPQFGNSIPLLFSDPSSIFMRARVKDLLFDGVRVVCNTEIHKQLNLICNVLRNNRPPTLRETSEKGVYAFSFFHSINATDQGPFTIFRGLKDKYISGYLSEYKGLPYSDYWYKKNCSPVKGTDGIFWPPMAERKPTVYTFVFDTCRSFPAEYKHDEVYNGLVGYYYRPSNSFWVDDPDCYCPRLGDGKIACPPRSVLDLTKCQEVPVFLSEPHFLDGESSLFSIIDGLNPVEETHAAYVVIEPLTGAPLSGSKKTQLNMMLRQEPVQLLANVSSGMFPFLWLEEGSSADLKLLEPVIFLHRIRRLLRFSIWLPFIFGVFYLMHFFWMNHGATNCLSKVSGRRTIAVAYSFKNTRRN